MNYISTRGNHPPCTDAEAINLGMVPAGGLFVPESFPRIAPEQYIGAGSYQEIAQAIFTPLLSTFTQKEIRACIDGAYNSTTFGTSGIIELHELDNGRSVMELWHGPTAAFKDVALQIMPHLMAVAKDKTHNKRHTVILVATSGDTGKAALEGFKNAKGISIIVFYPHEGVSEVQRLQMATTDGNNTHVIAVKGNFDDCQTGVKELFSNDKLRAQLAGNNIELSSANSINWGRLCPQIVYYFAAYADLVRRGKIDSGTKINFAIPTGNFGNILAGYYAMQMGLPVNKLLCASNKNSVLADFFATGIYNRNRTFYRTNSPSMDILISSNLERFLFEMCGHDSGNINEWYESLANTGSFTVGNKVLDAMRQVITAGWFDEDTILSTINSVYTKKGYVLDTHTAVAMALCDTAAAKETTTVIAATASPFKFSSDVLGAIEETLPGDEFKCINRIAAISGLPVHRAVGDLQKRPVLHSGVIDISEMHTAVGNIISQL